MMLQSQFRNTFRGFAAWAVFAATIPGCAQTVWLKDGATSLDFDRDRAQCEYEAAAATASYGSSSPTARGYSGALARGIVEGIDLGSRQAELMRLCLTARGYRRSVVAASEQMRAPSQMTEAELPNSQIVATDTAKSAIVRVLAEKNNCASTGDLTGSAGRNGRELYHVACEDGRRLQFGCLFAYPVASEGGIPMIQAPGSRYTQPACWHHSL